MADVAGRPPAEASGPTPPVPQPVATGKKGKAKKAASDPNETQRQLAARIAQFEQDQAGKVEEDAEIEREVRKANREMKDMLSTMGNANTKADHLHKKWMDLLGELKKTEREHTRAKKRADQLQKEKDTQRSELTKANSVKDKLERLSREITKDNKRLKDELRDTKEAAEGTNEELHRRLEQMMDEVELVIQSREDPAQFLGQMEEDEIFREKFKSMVEQYEMREIHFASVLRARELEIQYHIAQHDRLKKAQDAELTKSHQLTRQVSTFSQTENELRSQLNIYVEKFKQARALLPLDALMARSAHRADQQQVEDTLNNSNDLFLTFRKEMEEMSKKTKRLEKENMQLTRKQEATNKNIFQMAEERTQSHLERDRLIKENDKLRQICRAMQTKGYGRVPGMGEGPAVQGGNSAGGVASAEGGDAMLDIGETDSDYDDDEDDEDGDDYDDEEDSEEYDDETEEDEHAPPPPRTFGPVPPPPPPPQGPSAHPTLPASGKKQPNGVNGTRH